MNALGIQLVGIELPAQVVQYAPFTVQVQIWLPDNPRPSPYYNRYMLWMYAGKQGYPGWRDYESQWMLVLPSLYYTGVPTEIPWVGPGVYNINFNMVLDRYHAGIEAALGVYEARLLVWTGWITGEPPNYEFGGDELIVGYIDRWDREIGEKVGEFEVVEEVVESQFSQFTIVDYRKA